MNFFKPIYLIRLDDATPGMNKKNWTLIEDFLDRMNLKPLVACVPNNKDTSLNYGRGMGVRSYWDKVRSWDQKGWEIGVHGETHELDLINLNNQVVKINSVSEFAEKCYDKQVKKINRALNFFACEELKPRVFIAPAHSFDNNTISALISESNLRYISDGARLFPYTINKIRYMPQQLWKFRRLPIGHWTICVHPSTMTEKELLDFFRIIEKNSVLFQNFSDYINNDINKNMKYFWNPDLGFLMRLYFLLRKKK
ncbi:DUF2334 domain-containing protein [Amylibacter sp.]|nr:DUF2334 domain-containing protein [Amylibacter sp.]